MSDDYEELPANTPISLSMAAGAIAGIMEHTVMYPVDAIKTRVQVEGVSSAYRGVVNSLSQVSSTEGARALWRGVASVMAGAGPAHALHFAVYEAVTNIGQKNGHSSAPTASVSAIAGAAATISSDAIMTPFDVIKQHMQLETKRAGIFRTATQIWVNEGFSAFYVSYPITLVMNIPFTAINFTAYDQISHFLNAQQSHDPFVHCVAGGLAGATAAAVSTPFDVIKTLLQTRGMSHDKQARTLNSIAEASKFIYGRYGLVGFMRGVRLRILANMPSTAICWTVYEMAKLYISGK